MSEIEKYDKRAKKLTKSYWENYEYYTIRRRVELSVANWILLNQLHDYINII